MHRAFKRARIRGSSILRFRPQVELLEGRIVPSLTVPAYNSLPGAQASVYLNFNGDFVSSWLGFQNISIPVFGSGSGLTTRNAA